jgi:hypothetical protein
LKWFENDNFQGIFQCISLRDNMMQLIVMCVCVCVFNPWSKWFLILYLHSRIFLLKKVATLMFLPSHFSRHTCHGQKVNTIFLDWIVNISIEIDQLMLGKVISEIIWNKMDLLKHKVQIFNKFEFMVASLQSRTNANGIVQNDAPYVCQMVSRVSNLVDSQFYNEIQT